METFDIQFNDNQNSNSMGFTESIEACKNFISRHNGTDHSYFADYKGGTVGIVNNNTGEEVYSEDVK